MVLSVLTGPVNLPSLKFIWNNSPSSGQVSKVQIQIFFLKQDHFQYNEENVLNTVIMGNEKLLEVMKEKDIYAGLISG